MRPDAKMLALFTGSLLLLAGGIYFVVRSLTAPIAAEGTSFVAFEAGPTASADLHPDLLAGIEALGNDETERARGLFEGIPNTDPGYLIALRNLGIAQDRLGDHDGSFESFSTLATYEPENADAHLSAGWAKFRLGRYADAELSSLVALEVDHQHVAARYNVALIRVAQGKLQLAIGAYQRALKLDTPRSYTVQARDHLIELSERQPDLPAVHYALGFFANTLGSRSEEAESLERYLAFNPTGPAADTARENLERAHRDLGIQPN